MQNELILNLQAPEIITVNTGNFFPHAHIYFYLLLVVVVVVCSYCVLPILHLFSLSRVMCM